MDNRNLAIILFALLAGVLLRSAPALAQQVTDIDPPMTVAVGDHSSLSTSFPELINGNFDLPGGSGWVQQTNSPDSFHDLIVSENSVSTIHAYSPPNLVWLGGTPGVTDDLSQQISLPTGYPAVQLSYRYWITSEEQICGDDLFRLRVFLVSSGQYLTLESITLCRDTNTGGWQHRIVSLDQFVGQDVRIHFTASIDDDDDRSSIFLDNVDICDNSSQHPCDGNSHIYWNYLPMTSYHSPPHPSFPQLVNGYFDLAGGGGWQQATDSTAGDEHRLVVGEDSVNNFNAHTPPNLAWLGGAAKVTDNLSQQINLSATYPAVELSFQYRIESKEPSCGNDLFQVGVYLVTSSQYRILETMTLCTGLETDQWQPKEIPLGQFAGQDIRIHFVATTNGSEEDVSSLFLDSVKLCDRSSQHPCD